MAAAFVNSNEEMPNSANTTSRDNGHLLFVNLFIRRLQRSVVEEGAAMSDGGGGIAAVACDDNIVLLGSATSSPSDAGSFFSLIIAYSMNL